MTHLLSEILSVLPEAASQRLPDLPVTRVTDDSRSVDSASIFVAIKGENADGHDFIDQVMGKGPAAILSTRVRPAEYQGVWLQVFDTRRALGLLAAAFHDHPSRDLGVIGVTGTNGKTTVTHFLRHLLENSMFRCGMIGTVKVHNGKALLDATHTTPGALQLQALLKEMKENQCKVVAMEVSSHGLEQSRVAGVDFQVGVFLNLTQDHLDYHGTMEEYFRAKRLLFQNMANAGGGTAVINIDDPHGRKLAEEFGSRLKVLTYGYHELADLRISAVRSQFYGQEFALTARGRDYLVRLPCVGEFNALNAIAALGACAGLGLRIRDVVKHLTTLPQTPGRMECVGGEASPVFIDYAHTPDALEKVCKTLKELNPAHLITVFGCGGDRDRTKRPLMAAAAAKYSDYTIITSDNPRSEDPQTIIEDALPGLEGRPHGVVLDRKMAIIKAIEMSRARDIVLIAGKGHEDYQEINGKRVRFDDREAARDAVRIFTKMRDQKRMEKHKEREAKRRAFPRPESDDQDRPDRQEPSDWKKESRESGEFPPHN